MIRGIYTDKTACGITLAASINENMPYHIANRITEALNDRGKSVRGARILILGVAYKKDVGDCRESPSLKLMQLLSEKGARGYSPSTWCKKGLKKKAIVWSLTENRNNSERRHDGQQEKDKTIGAVTQGGDGRRGGLSKRGP